MNKKVCVIGAGPSGLVAVKELLEVGLDIKCFESQKEIGGAFTAFKNAGQSYDSLQLTVSNYFMSYSDFMPKPNESRAYWNAKEYRKYLLNYVKHNKLSKYIYTSHNVISASVKDSKVVVTVANKKKKITELFDYLVICSGSNSIPKFPFRKNRHLFKGKLMHSSEYKNNRGFKNKKVVCIGLGESGADIVHEISLIASSCKVLIRDYPNVIPRWINGYTNDSYTTHYFYAAKTMGINRFMTFKAWYYLNFHYNLSNEDRLIQQWVMKRKNFMGKFFTKSDVFIKDVIEGRIQLIKDGQESFADSVIITEKGQNIEADVIVCNTGYKTCFEHFSFGVDFANPRKLFKQMISLKHGTRISLIGWARPTQGGLPACSEMQARYLAQLISGKKGLPTRSVLKIIIEKDESYYENLFKNSSEIKSLVSYHDFMISMAKLIGCKPKLFNWRDLKLTRKLFLGSHISAFYRLSSSTTKKSALSSIKSLPIVYTKRRFFTILLFILVFNPLSRINNFIVKKRIRYIVVGIVKISIVTNI